VLGNSVRGMLPAVPGILVVLATRLATWGGDRTTGNFLAELALFAVFVVAVTLWSERSLLREFRGYLHGPGSGVRSSLDA